jgi:hypothetical protein
VRLIVVVCVKLAEVPLIPIENVPVKALLLADSVSVLLLAVLPGLKDAVTPRGRPEADKLTLPAKPFCGVIVIVDMTFALRARLNEFGEAKRAKSGAGVTVRETVVTCDKLPDVPVMNTATVPSAAAPLAVSVSVLEVVVLPGLNVAVTPLGRPEAERLTLLLKPFSGVTEMVLVPFVPWATLRLLGEAESAKSPVGFTVRITVALLLRLPEVPVMVTVKGPVAAVPVADRVKRLEVVAGFVSKLALTPFGRPDAVKFTLPTNPFKGLMVMVVEPAAPCEKVNVAGDAERVKFCCGAEAGQLLTKLAALTLPMPVAKSQPVVVP